MSSSDRLADLPAPIADRARHLTERGLPLTLAVGRATSELTYSNSGWSHEDIAEAFDVTVDTLRTYASKAGSEASDAEELFITQGGGPSHILAKTTTLRNDTIYITAPLERIRTEEEYRAACSGEEGVRVVTVKKGGPSGEPNGLVEVRSERFDSLVDLADEKYLNSNSKSTERANRWYSLLTEAGIEEESLPKPGETLPDSHPDSPNHLQYQLRSLERDEGRGRPRR